MANHYFKSLPNIQYRNPLSNIENDYVTAKNLFVRAKIRDDVLNAVTFLRAYTIEDGERPMDVAETMYGDPLYDWVVLITANIINVRNDWPLSNRDIYDFALNKYGNELNEIRYYETKEIKDSNGKLILPEGKRVNSDFSIRFYDTNQYVEKSGSNVVSGISNYTHELNLNTKKREIFLLKSEYLQQFLNDFRDVMVYGRSSQYVDDDLIKTENTNITMPY